MRIIAFNLHLVLCSSACIRCCAANHPLITNGCFKSSITAPLGLQNTDHQPTSEHQGQLIMLSAYKSQWVAIVVDINCASIVVAAITTVTHQRHGDFADCGLPMAEEP